MKITFQGGSVADVRDQFMQALGYLVAAGVDEVAPFSVEVPTMAAGNPVEIEFGDFQAPGLTFSRGLVIECETFSPGLGKGVVVPFSKALTRLPQS